MGYLGFWVTHDVVKPIDKNISNRNMKPYTPQKQARQFMYVGNYYRNMWERSSHTLAPLTSITSSKVKI